MSKISFQSLKKNLKRDLSSLKVVRIAIMGDTATQLFVQAIKGYGVEENLNIVAFEADFNQVELQVFNPSSEFYRFNPDYVVLFYSSQELLKNFVPLGDPEKMNFAQNRIARFEQIYNTITSGLQAKVLFLNFQEINDGVFGNYANKTEHSFLYQLRKINFELMNLAIRLKNLFIVDVNILQGRFGEDFLCNQRMFVNTNLLFNVDFLPFIAKEIISVIQSVEGKFRKCLILDLDNTIWGGVIGDDGIENIQIGNLGIGKAFSDLQLWAKQLKQRGIILAVCSKNEEVTAKEPFLNHPDMVLSLDDIALFVANWNSKVDNIKYIQKTLNLGFDSMVYIDDNPCERDLIRSSLPEIEVPELPEDPADYCSFLQNLNLFETASYTSEDVNRTRQYVQELNRVAVQQQYNNEDEFLQSLNMVSRVSSFDEFNIPRIAQLTQRTNQFNLRTVRYTDEDVARISEDSSFFTFSFNLTDKYGDYGLVSLIILRKTDNKSLFIDTWVMSCRVFNRNLEAFVMNYVIDFASRNEFLLVAGEYLPTLKNAIVKDLYSRLGFVEDHNRWVLKTENYKIQKTYITLISK